MNNPNPDTDERVRQREEITGHLIRTILSRQRELNNLRDLKDRFLLGEASEQAVLSLIGTGDNFPQWSKGLPQESGWYWARLNNVGTPIVVEFIWNPVAHGEGKVRLIPKVRYPGQGGLLEVEPTCAMYEFLGPITPTSTNDAATRIRDRCVEKVRARLSDPSLRFYDDGIKAAIIDWTNYMTGELQSLTLEQGEQEK